MESGGPHKHLCKICDKSFSSGRALGGHMSCHWRGDKQPKSTPSPPAIVVDLHVSLLDPCDEKPSLPSLETQGLHCSKVFPTCQSLRGHMRIHGEKKVMAKPEEEPAGLMEPSANADGDRRYNMMIFSPVKRKRSKRGIPVLDSEEMDAAVTLLMLADHSGKTSAYEDFCGGDKDDCSLAPNLFKEVKLNAFDHQLVQFDEFMEPNTDKNSVNDDFYEHCENESNFNLVADAPKVQLNSFDHGLDQGAEFMKPGADNSVEELKSHLSAAVNVKSHQCNVCGKSLRSGQALGGHMRYHYVRRCNRRQGVADCPDSTMMEQQKQKLELDSELLDSNLPALIDGDNIHMGVKS
ncbi:uncharacterized protein LOC133905801 [Phragmites australis]|uniref:uncharacterized protein LOC133905801 n=1 Tax=Phragmites australis TaxID=29695 RepID=UPI002D797CA3|nr:uncharacterized protein LOC133905801 [Phragmites australis]